MATNAQQLTFNFNLDQDQDEQPVGVGGQEKNGGNDSVHEIDEEGHKRYNDFIAFLDKSISDQHKFIDGDYRNFIEWLDSQMNLWMAYILPDLVPVEEFDVVFDSRSTADLSAAMKERHEAIRRDHGHDAIYKEYVNAALKIYDDAKEFHHTLEDDLKRTLHGFTPASDMEPVMELLNKMAPAVQRYSDRLNDLKRKFVSEKDNHIRHHILRQAQIRHETERAKRIATLNADYEQMKDHLEKKYQRLRSELDDFIAADKERYERHALSRYEHYLLSRPS